MNKIRTLFAKKIRGLLLFLVRYTKNSQIMASNKLGGFTAASLTVTSSLVWQDWYHHRVTDVSESYSWDRPWPVSHNGGGTQWPGKLARNSPQWTAAKAAAAAADSAAAELDSRTLRYTGGAGGGQCQQRNYCCCDFPSP